MPFVNRNSGSISLNVPLRLSSGSLDAESAEYFVYPVGPGDPARTTLR